MTTPIPYINPRNVPESALGEGWRYLTEDERENPPMDTKELEAGWVHDRINPGAHLEPDTTYITRSPLPEKYRPLVIEAGKSYKDGFGLRVDIVCTDSAEDPTRPAVGLRHSKNGKFLRYYSLDGKRFSAQAGLGDIIAPWIKTDPYAELKAAHKAGKKLQIISHTNGTWIDLLHSPTWSNPVEHYRIKPATKTMPLYAPENWIGLWWVEVEEKNLSLVTRVDDDYVWLNGNPWEIRKLVGKRRANGTRDSTGDLIWEPCSREVEA